MTSLTPASPFHRPGSHAYTARVTPAAPTLSGAPCAPCNGVLPDTQGNLSEPHGRCSSDPLVNPTPVSASCPAPSLSGLTTQPHRPRASPSPPNQQSLVRRGQQGASPPQRSEPEASETARNPQLRTSVFRGTSATAQAQRSQHDHNRCGHPPRRPNIYPHAKE